MNAWLGSESWGDLAMLRIRQIYAAPAPLPHDIASWVAEGCLRDATGGPLPLYHGSPKRFEKFEPMPHIHAGATPYFDDGVHRERARHCVYLTADPALATAYAKGGWVHVVYLRMKNPYRMADRESIGGLTDATRAELVARGHDGAVFGYINQSEYAVFHPEQARIVAVHPAFV